MGMCKPSGRIDSKIGKVGGLKAYGLPNTRVELYDENGELLTQRWYGPDGRALLNRDWKHSDKGKEKHKFPHDHPWDWSKNKPRGNYDQSREIDENFCKKKEENKNMKTKLSREELEQIKIKQKNRYKIETKCDVCGKIISVDEIGNGSGCKNCGWVQDLLSEEFPDRVMCPNLIPLSKAKKLHIEKNPLLPDFDDFIGGLDFYGEMQFTYQGIDYGVTRGKNDTVDLWIVNAEVLGTFKDSEKFKENAKIDGKLIKDIWQEVKDVNWLQ